MFRQLEAHDPCLVGDRLDGLAQALQDAARGTRENRDYNRTRLEARATKQEIVPGDTVVLKNNRATQFEQRWHPEYEVIRVTGPVLKCRHQQSGYIKTVNRCQVRVVPRDLVWDLAPTPPPVRPRERPYLGRTAKQWPIRYEDDPDWTPPPLTRAAAKRRADAMQAEEDPKRRCTPALAEGPVEIEVEVERKRAGEQLPEDGPSEVKKSCSGPEPCSAIYICATHAEERKLQEKEAVEKKIEEKRVEIRTLKPSYTVYSSQVHPKKRLSRQVWPITPVGPCYGPRSCSVTQRCEGHS